MSRIAAPLTVGGDRGDRPLVAIAMVVVAFALFSSVDADAKWLVNAGLPVFQVAFMRYAAHLGASLLWQPRALLGEPLPAPRLLGWVGLRGLLLAASTGFNFVALSHLPLTTTAAILFSAPLWICALSGPVLGERVGPWRWSAVVVGLIGVLIAMRPGGGFHWAMLCSLAAALSFAGYSLLSRRLAGQASVSLQQLISGVVGALALAPLAIPVWVWPADAGQWVLLIAVGVIAWIGHEFHTRAHALAPASVLTPFSYLLMVYMGAWGWLLFGQLPDRWTVLGAGMAILAGGVIWWRERCLGVGSS